MNDVPSVPAIRRRLLCRVPCVAENNGAALLR